MKKILFTIIVLFIIAPAIWAQSGSNSWGTFVPYDSTQTVEIKSSNLDAFDVRSLGMEEPGRFLSIDPMSHKYPSWSPYVYVMNNPVRYIDPDGREVRCRSEDDCNRAAQELNETHGNETNITVVETSWEESTSKWWNPLSWGSTETVEGYKLSTEDSSFDWEAGGEYTQALFEVINDNDIVFNFQFVPGNTLLTTHPFQLTAYQQQGKMVSYPGGGNVYVSADGNRLNEPTGVVIMHELVGHGHPAGGGNAHNVNRHYQSQLGYRLTGSRGLPHGGYHTTIGWPKK